MGRKCERGLGKLFLNGIIEAGKGEPGNRAGVIAFRTLRWVAVFIFSVTGFVVGATVGKRSPALDLNLYTVAATATRARQIGQTIRHLVGLREFLQK